MDISKLIQSQRVFFNSDVTKDVRFRTDALERLYDAIVMNEEDILKALKEDLNKSSFEGYMSEIGMVRDEIRHFIKHMKRWSKPKRVPTPACTVPIKKLYHGRTIWCCTNNGAMELSFPVMYRTFNRSDRCWKTAL